MCVLRVFRWAACLLALTCCVAARAQEGGSGASAAGDHELTLHVTTRDILVDVVATDRHDHPLSDLQLSDFEVDEVEGSRRVPEKVSAVYLVDPAKQAQQQSPPEGLQVTLGGSCAERNVPHYVVAYHVSADGLASGYHEVVVRTTRRDARLAFGHRYYVGQTQALAGAPVAGEALDAMLLEAACYHPEVPASIPLSIEPIEREDPDVLSYFVTVQAGALPLISLSIDSRQVQVDYGVCTFNADGRPLRYVHSAANETLTLRNYVEAQEHGFPERVAFSRTGDPAYARVVVRDEKTGNVGLADVVIAAPKPGQLTAAEQAAADAWEEATRHGRRPDVSNFPPMGPIGSFGTVVPLAGALCGDVYALPEGTSQLPNFWSLSSLGSLYTETLDVPHQQFWNTGGVPGVTRRTDWFGVDNFGTIWIKVPGEYGFDLISDDGAKLYIDDDLVVNADHIQNAMESSGKVKLDVGRHTIHVPYFQGPPNAVALQLMVKPPGGELELFDLRDFAPPEAKETPRL